MPRFTSCSVWRLCPPLLLALFAFATPGRAQSCLTFRHCPGLVADWDTAVVNAFLKAHQLPSTDRGLIETYGRDDLRNDLRGFALAELMAVIQVPEAQRTATQQAVGAYFADQIKLLEIAAAQAAVDHKNSLVSNLCGWKPEAELAKAFSFTYDGTFFCGDRNALFLGTFPPVFPTRDYFKAYGLKTTYFDPLKNYVNGLASYREISANGKLTLIYGSMAGLGLGALVAGLMFIHAVQKFVFPWLGSLKLCTCEPIGLGITVALLVITVTVAIFVFFEGQAQLTALGKLDTDLAAVRAGRVDLSLMSKDPKGFARLTAAYSAMALTPFGGPPPAPTPLPARTAVDPVFVIRNPITNVETVSDKLVYRNWSNVTSEAQMYGGWFLQKIGLGGSSYDSFGLKLRFFANGAFYTLDRSGAVLLVTKEEPAPTDIDCPAGRDGYTNYAPLSVCKSYVAKSVLMELPEGQRQVSVAQAPAFLSAPAGAFTIGGGAQSISVQATGLPLPSIQTSSALPAGVTFESSAVAGAGKGVFRYDGTSGTPVEANPILTATHAGGTAVQTFKLTIASVVKIVPPTPPTVDYGTPIRIPLQITGFPRPVLGARTTGGLTWSPFCGLWPNWDSNGNAWLEGTPVYSDLTGRNICEGILRADNGLSADEIYVSFPGKTPVQPVLSANTFRFKVNEPNSVTLRTTPPSDAKVIIQYPRLSSLPGYPNAPPAWLQLTDHGDGTATLSGTPPLYAAEHFNVEVEVFTEGALAGYKEENLLRMHVVKYPVVSSVPYGIFNTVSTADYSGTMTLPGQVTILPNEQNVGLPDGFALVSPGDQTFRIYGRGNAGGEATFYLRTGNFMTTLAEVTPFRAIIGEPPKLSMPFSINFYVGQSKSLPLLAAGYPVRPIDGIPGAPGPMDISYRGILPAGLDFVTTDPDTGPTYGKAVIRGTPTTPGSTMLVIFANNGVAPTASQSIFLNVTIPGDVNFDGRVDCSDARFITAKYGQRRGTTGYDWNADYNLDGYIDVRDLAQVSSKLPTGTRCQ